MKKLNEDLKHWGKKLNRDIYTQRKGMTCVCKRRINVVKMVVLFVKVNCMSTWQDLKFPKRQFSGNTDEGLSYVWACLCVIILIGLIEKGRYAHYGWHHSLGWGPGLYNRERKELSTSTHSSLLPDCGCNMTNCIKIMGNKRKIKKKSIFLLWKHLSQKLVFIHVKTEASQHGLLIQNPGVPQA